jgi:two-component system LytT family sensor kinase
VAAHNGAMAATAPPSSRLIIGWLAFCALMVVVGMQEQWFEGRGALGWRFFDEVVSMATATAVAAWRWRRGPHEDRWLATPGRWFWRAARTLPVIAPLFVIVVYAVRHAARALLDASYGHPPWPAVMVYESFKFGVFFLLFAGVQFGLRSHLALARERESVERTQRLLADARLAQLTQQMQPHFLFNALNTIAALVHDDPQAADTALTRLATLLRGATDARALQPLADELQLARSYAGLMQQRFGERVRLHWHIAPGLETHPVPTLSLQPLLENCFVHGVERQLGPVDIEVAVRSDGTHLHLAVLGSAGSLAPDWRAGVGIGNLRQRLATLYGDAADLQLLPAADGSRGVQARLRLPLADVNSTPDAASA